LFGPRAGARAQFSDEFAQRLRASGVGYDYGMTRIYQMAADCARYVAGAYKSYFHNCLLSILFTNIANVRLLESRGKCQFVIAVMRI
jgi:hypothetical protein